MSEHHATRSAQSPPGPVLRRVLPALVAMGILLVTGAGALLYQWIVRDIPADNTAFARALTLGATGGVVALALLLGYISVLLRRTDADIRAQQAELRESELSYRHQFDNSSAVMLLVDPADGAIVDANPAAVGFYGYPRERLVAMRITDINQLPVSDVRQAMASVSQERGKRFTFQHRLADGSIRDVDVSASSLHVGGRTVLHSIIQDITERAQAERALRESVRRSDTILESVQSGVLLIDAQTHRIVEVNPAAAAMAGATREEMIGHVCHKFVCPADEGACPVLDKGLRVDNSERILLTKDGASLPILKTANRVTLDGRECLLESFVDIGSQKQTEGKLRENRARLELAIEAARMGIWHWDMIENRRSFDGRVCQLLGLDPATFRGTAEEFFGTIHPDDRNAVKAALASAVEQDTRYDPDYRVIWPDGQMRTVAARGSVVRDGDGKAVRMDGVLWDKTDRKRADEALRDAHWRLHSIIEGTHVGTWEWNVQTGETIFNDVWAQMLGYTLDELAPISISTWEALAHPNDLKHSAELLERHFAGELPFYDDECRMKHKDGHWVWVRDRGRVMTRTGDGKPLMMFGTHTDITAQKRAETELYENSRQLEAVTWEAHEMAFRAEEANRAKSEFLANMSHEIRTPMNGVIGMTGLLMDTDLDQTQRHYAEVVRSSGESLLALLNDILDFSKIEAGKLDLETLDFDLSSLLDDFAVTMAVRAQEKELELLCAADPDVPVRLRGDPGRLRQVLTNLTSNAVKFTHAGEVVVRVSVVEDHEPQDARVREDATESQALSRDEVLAAPVRTAPVRTAPVSGDEVVLRFSVRDTGIGIPADKIGLLFNKFSQVDASTTRQYGGTGLGLAISKQLAELMGGAIGVVPSTSIPSDSTGAGCADAAGPGSEFWFTARFGIQAEETQTDSLSPADLRGVRALIVDDNSTSRDILTIRLASWGMRPLAVSGGPGALQALHRALVEHDPFQIVAIDGHMPGMDGAALARAIRADTALVNTRLVLMTSLGQRGDARHMEQIGFDGYLTKPTRHHELKAVLALTLADRHLCEPTSQPLVTRHTVRETLTRFTGRKARVLLAEDNITNQQVALGILKKLGLHADAVANGAEAVKALETLPYDLVLMDVQMPEMDGLEATRVIRDPQSAVRNRQIPIIAMTAHAMQGDREICLAAGMNDYVTKPVSPQALADALNTWLPNEEVARPEHATGAPDKTAAVSAQAHAQEADLPVFDKAGMLSRLMDDEDLARTVAESFLDDIPQRISDLKACLETGDVQGAERQAHTVKGSSANVGAERLRAAAFEIEKAAKAGDVSVVHARMADLERQFEALRDAMQQGI